MPKVSDAPATREKSLLDQLADAVLIDKHNLDEAWVEQPDIFWRVSDQLAKANNARDRYKLERDQVLAQVETEVRLEAEKAGAKVTVSSVAAEVELDQRVVAARTEYQRLCYTSDRWSALKEAYHQRSYALKDITALHISNYYQNNSGGAQRDQVADKNRRDAGEQRRKG